LKSGRPAGEAGAESDALASLETKVERHGTALESNGDPDEAEGVLNPASARSRDGKLLLYPRVVAEGNRSRVGLCEERIDGGLRSFLRLGYALQPEAPDEIRTGTGGYGCEDPRVTFVPELDRYVMLYTAFGPLGPRIAIALSYDGYEWNRLGLLDFAGQGLIAGDDKDGALFPASVISPRGVRALAFYHRPMLKLSELDGHAGVSQILELPPNMRESTRIGYVPLEPVLSDIRNLLAVAESTTVLLPGGWDRVKTGAGTPPVRVEEGWLSVYHGVDPIFHDNGRTTLRYAAGVVIHDAEQPHILRYRSPLPVMVPETPEERSGVVNDVVFPTAIDRPPDAPNRTYDIYYGMADTRVGLARFSFGQSVAAATAGAGNAA
jgi:predicted GH43/DUF377 family glycosyl hydrolase